MNTNKMAGDYINKGKRYLKEAEDAFSGKDYATTVRRAQECVEMSLKGALRVLGLEYPSQHDVSNVLKKIDKKQLPEWFRAKIPDFADISKELSVQRGPAMYGYEAELKPASEIFDADDAKHALESAKMVYELCEKFIDEHINKSIGDTESNRTKQDGRMNNKGYVW